MNNNILILGYFGYRTNQIDGQTIKTRQVFNLFKQKTSGSNDLTLDYFDTQSLQFCIFNYLHLLGKLFKSKQIIYMPGRGNFKLFFPILFFLSFFSNKSILLIAIGGWLSEYLVSLSLHQYLIRQISVVLVESYELKNNLISNNSISRVEVIPNFRIHKFVPIMVQNKIKKLDMVFMSRITETKGVNYIFDFFDWMSLNGDYNIQIDFYGPIDDNYKKYFLSKVNSYSQISYNGIVEPDDVYTVLTNYDLLVLPTFYDGEGFPGAIIDAYISGIPVIASNWKQIPEYIDQGNSGFLFDLDKKEDFYNYLILLYHDQRMLYDFKIKSKIKSLDYSSDKAWNIISNYLYI